MTSIIGAHTSISKGILNGIKCIEKLGGNCLQIFLGSTQTTNLKNKTKITDEQIKEIKKYIKQKNIKLFIHTIYLLNFCKFPAKDKRIQYAIDNLVYDLKLTNELGGIGCVLHIGYQKELEEMEAYINMAQNVMYAIDLTPNINTLIILETPAGKGTQIGTSLEEFSRLWNMIDEKYYSRLGICVDTAHIFSSGRDIRNIEGIENYLNEFDKLIGLKYLTLFHINDSKAILNSRKDLHEGIGNGYIYGSDKGGDLNSLKYIWNFSLKNGIPMVLETHGSGCSDSVKGTGFYEQEIKLFRDWDYGLEPEKTFQLTSSKESIIKPDNSIIIDVFKKLSKCYGKNKDRIRKNAYDKAVMSLKNYNYKITSGKQVSELPGIGKKIIEKIDEILETGTLKLLSSLDNCEDSELTKVLGIGEVFAEKLNKDYNITTVKQLKNSKVELNETQKLGLKYYDDLNKKVTVDEAIKIVDKIKDVLKKKNFIEDYNLKIELAGSLSKGTGVTSSKDVDVLITTKKFRTKETLEKTDVFEKMIDELVKEHIITHVVNLGKTKLLGICKLDENAVHRHIDIRFITNTSYVYARSYFTSGRTFNIMFRANAKKEGYKLNEWGLYDSDNNFVKVKSERELFKLFKLDYIPPNKRR